MISIIVPAHNEERVIARCLHTMIDSSLPGELEIIVVCNGCTDQTATMARSVGDTVRVVETDPASKIIALNLGDSAATGFPRFYVDADVLLPIESIRRVSEVLRRGQYQVAAPRIRVALHNRGWLVRSFYHVWTRLPYLATAAVGSGVYALSQAGRARFACFPDIIADDEYVRRLFPPEERYTVSDCFFTIHPPKTLWALIEIKTRTHKGNYQLSAVYPELRANDAKNYGPSLRGFLREPAAWPRLLVYALVMGAAKLRGYWKFRQGDLQSWEREEDSRSVGHP